MEEIRSELQGSGSFKTFVRSVTGQKNLLINGGLEIWRRGISFSSVSLNQYLADRWFLKSNPGGSPGNVQVSRVTGNFSPFAMQINDLNVGGAITIAQQLPVSLIQKAKKLGYLTVSADLRSPSGLADVSLGIASGDAPGFNAEKVAAVDGVWKRVTLVIDVKTFVTGDLFIFIKPRTTAGDTGTVEVDNVMLCAGIFADGADFELLPTELEEHTRANIYYEDGVFNFHEFVDTAGGGQGYGRIVSFKNRKRGVPSINFDTPIVQTNVSTFSATKIDEDSFLLRVFPTVSGVAELQVKWKADAEI